MVGTIAISQATESFFTSKPWWSSPLSSRTWSVNAGMCDATLFMKLWKVSYTDQVQMKLISQRDTIGAFHSISKNPVMIEIVCYLQCIHHIDTSVPLNGNVLYRLDGKHPVFINALKIHCCIEWFLIKPSMVKIFVFSTSFKVKYSTVSLQDRFCGDFLYNSCPKPNYKQESPGGP